jgi:hypothetical protein
VCASVKCHCADIYTRDKLAVHCPDPTTLGCYFNNNDGSVRETLKNSDTQKSLDKSQLTFWENNFRKKGVSTFNITFF